MKKILVPFLVFMLHCATAQTNSSMPLPVKGEPVEGITPYKLANGLTVLIFPDPSVATITVNLTYMVGSRQEGYGETGMAHLLEHMLFKGSKNHTNIPQELTAHGGYKNATTDYDRTNYFEIISASDENLKWALEMESDRMVNSFIAKKDLESEFSVVRNEFESGENYPQGILEERVMSTAYLWHNYGKSVIGSKEDIERVPIENLQAFYHKYYQPDNAVLLVAGKIDADNTIKMVNETFGVIPKPARVLSEPYTVEPTQDGERYVELKRVGDVQVASAGYHVPSSTHADYPAIRVLADVLSNQPSGRLYKALVDSKKASSVYAYSHSLKDPGYLYIQAEILKDKSLADTKQTMLEVLDSLQFNPVTNEEVERAKNKILKNFELTYNNSEWFGLNLSSYVAEGDWRLMFLYRDQIEKVTAADVNRAIKAYLKSSNRTVGVFIPEATPDRAEIPASPDLSNQLNNYKGKKALEAAESFDPSPANIDARTKTGNIPGGAKYALLTKSTRGNSVNAQITLYIGTEQSLQNKTIAAQLTASMLDKGTTTKTRQQIRDELDKLKARLYFYGSGQNVTVSIETVKENFVPVLKLVTDMLRHPTFKADEFDKLIQTELSNIEQQKSDPQSIAFNEFERVTHPRSSSDFRYQMNFDEQTQTTKNAKLDELKKFYADFYNGAKATVAVVGSFDEKPVVAELNNMLQNWTAAAKYVRAADTFKEVVSKSKKINTPDKANATIVCGYNLALRDDDPDYPALIIGNEILGGGFLNSRLATRMRQKEGISYSIESWISADEFDKNGSFQSYAIYNPDNCDKLLNCYKEEFDKILKGGVNADELKDARTGYLQEQNVNRAQDGSLVYMLSSNLYINRTMKWAEAKEKKIAGLTVEQINATLKKWIAPEKINYIMAGDFERKK